MHVAMLNISCEVVSQITCCSHCIFNFVKSNLYSLLKISEANLKSTVKHLEQKYQKINFVPGLHFYTASKNHKVKTFLTFPWDAETHD